MDCRETEEVSVLLLSKAEAATGLGAVTVRSDTWLELIGLEMPVISIFANPSTSRLCLSVSVPAFFSASTASSTWLG